MLEAIIGLIGGVLIGSTGAGTGSLLTPLLILAGYRPALAIGTGMGSLFVSKLVGSVAHRRLGHWPGRTGWYVLAGGVVGVVLAWTIASHWVPSGGDTTMRRLVGATLLIASAAATFASKRQKADENDASLPSKSLPTPRPWLLLAVGILVAAVVSLTSAGSGSLLVTFLLLATSWRVPQLAAMSNIFGSFVGALTLGLHWKPQDFDPHLFGLVMFGVIPGVLAGVLLSRWISRQWLVWGVYTLSIFLGVALLA
ncbi:MAG TPA: sulfite exporter TauE/SafE family protein [Thermoanaerobaculia bacterium]|nr:sulfite exporter TauE/SafE family protein [Thermoanaerobaculia bacterium]